MSFRSAGFRPAVFGTALTLMFALPAGAALAQAGTPATASTAAAPAAAAVAAAPPPAQVALRPGDAKIGQAKAAVCGACHGLDGNSVAPQFPKLAGQNAQYIVRQLTDFKSGKRQNPIMLGMATPLSTQDMRDVAAYFSSKKSLPGVADQALVERGQTLFREGDPAQGVPACMACHSIDGRGNPGAMYPQLAGQHAQYVEATLKAWHDGTSWGDDAHSRIMPTIARKLDANDIAAVASYVEGLHGVGSTTAAAP